jgi:hypothetical protein
MNERLQELADQAGLFSARPEGGKSRVLLAVEPGTEGEIADPDEQLEKFAKLIVNECMYVGRLAQINNQLVDIEIKDHFGIDHFGVTE